MSRFKIEKAVRRGNKARVALAAPAGGGKTYTALILAKELAEGGDVLVIDTERGSASLYADQFEFQTLKWEPPYNPTELGQVIGEVAGNFAVVVVDSLSHFWMGEGGTLDMVDAASERAKGNKFAGWKTGTPAQNDMVDAMLRAPAHVIVTMRSKMEYVQDKDEKGRTTIRRVGMAPVQRDGIEYEFTVTADLDIEHRLSVAKTRCSVLADKVYRPGHAGEMGKALHDWLDGAEADTATRPVAVVPSPAGDGTPEFTDDDVTLIDRQTVRDFCIAMGAAFPALKAKDLDDLRHAIVHYATKGRTWSSKATQKTEWPAVLAVYRWFVDGKLVQVDTDEGPRLVKDLDKAEAS